MKKGALVTYGTKDSSPEAPEEDYAEDRPFDLLEDRDLPPRQPALEQGAAAESSQAAERLALTPAAAAAWVRPLQLEPDDDEAERPELDTPNGMPPLSEYVPIQDWHPLRFVFDEDDRLIIPPGPVPAMHAFITQARKVVCQFNLEDIKVKGFVGPRPGAGQRPTSRHRRSDWRLQTVGPEAAKVVCPDSALGKISGCSRCEESVEKSTEASQAADISSRYPRAGR